MTEPIQRAIDACNREKEACRLAPRRRRQRHPEKAAHLLAEGNALWAARSQSSEGLSTAIQKWEAAANNDYTRVDVLMALARGYAAQLPTAANARARKTLCFKGWKISSQAVELTSTLFVERLRHESSQISMVWAEALSLVERRGAEPLYWFAHYDYCLYSDSGRKAPALRHVDVLDRSIARDRVNHMPAP